MNKKWIIVVFKRCVYVANSFVFPPSAFGWVTYIVRNFLDIKSRLNILIFIFYMKPVPMCYFQSVLVVVPRKNLVKTWDNARTCMVVISHAFCWLFYSVKNHIIAIRSQNITILSTIWNIFNLASVFHMSGFSYNKMTAWKIFLIYENIGLVSQRNTPFLIMQN